MLVAKINKQHGKQYQIPPREQIKEQNIISLDLASEYQTLVHVLSSMETVMLSG